MDNIFNHGFTLYPMAKVFTWCELNSGVWGEIFMRAKGKEEKSSSKNSV